jgi:dienelactone hydrolase
MKSFPFTPISLTSIAMATCVLASLSACGGGEPQTAAAPRFNADAALMGSETSFVEAADGSREKAKDAVVTMTKVSFTNSTGQALTGFYFENSGVPQRNAAVVMMHGCAGVWSNGVISTDAQPAINKLAQINGRWGRDLANRGYKVLLVDSFTSRSLTNECNNGTAGLNEAVERPKDALAGRAWLLANASIAADRVALMGWSNGGSAVMATMDTSNRGTGSFRPFAEAFSFYPGCRLINEFGGDASTLTKTTWLPYAPITIHHGSMDPLYRTDANTPSFCDNRVTKAQQLGASTTGGNAVSMVIYEGARHSFDLINIANALVSPYTQADVTAQTSADASVVAALATRFPVQ